MSQEKCTITTLAQKLDFSEEIVNFERKINLDRIADFIDDGALNTTKSQSTISLPVSKDFTMNYKGVIHS